MLENGFAHMGLAYEGFGVAERFVRIFYGYEANVGLGGVWMIMCLFRLPRYRESCQAAERRT